jgi:ferric-dicitrate binding protein FerR (iron transport regulator)
MNIGKDELRDLFSALNEGTISPENHARLSALLENDAEVRALWFVHCDIETGLAGWAASRPLKGELRELATNEASKDHRWFGPVLAVAAAVAAMVFWWAMSGAKPQELAGEAPATGVALLSRGNAVFSASGPLNPGATLSAGELRVKSGAAIIEFFNGARVLMEGPSILRLQAADSAYLVSGKLNASVPPQARGFAVSTEAMKVVDLGTSFGIDTGAPRGHEVHVFEGTVQVAIPSAPPRLLKAGDGVRIESSAIIQIPANRPHFLGEDELAAREAARLADWRNSARALTNGDAALLHYAFGEATAGSRTVGNRKNDASPESNGAVVGATWGPGRWEGRNALYFRSEADRVRLSIPERMQAITLIAWVKIDTLQRPQNVLFSTDAAKPGAVNWHVTKNGELRLEIARDLKRPSVDWEAVNSTPFVTTHRLGSWVMLATTFDGKVIRHYGNGELIGSGDSFTPPEIQIGAAELGNWRGNTQRQLSGAFDEFAMVSRAFTDEEVRSLYESGKP